ncbi:MAG: DUF1292 domain-containing protein [Clostridia bacterium]|nr:DUF1292 domain-containing protein [Clostridia bacterium]
MTEQNELELGHDFITISDDEGNEFEFEVLDRVEDDDGRYVALAPVYDNPEDELAGDGQLVILRVVEEDGEEFFEEFDDEDKFQEIADIFMDRLSEEYEFDDQE